MRATIGSITPVIAALPQHGCGCLWLGDVERAAQPRPFTSRLEVKKKRTNGRVAAGSEKEMNERAVWVLQVKKK